MRLGHVARWAPRAVPGVYGAARSAGLGRPAAVRVLQASAYALLIARRRHPRDWRAENAVRHFIWQAWLAAAFGPKVADAVGHAHEQLSSDPADSAVDERNNRLGREYGDSHADAIRGKAVWRAMSALADEADQRWEAGRLGIA